MSAADSFLDAVHTWTSNPNAATRDALRIQATQLYLTAIRSKQRIVLMRSKLEDLKAAQQSSEPPLLQCEAIITALAALYELVTSWLEQSIDGIGVRSAPRASMLSAQRSMLTIEPATLRKQAAAAAAALAELRLREEHAEQSARLLQDYNDRIDAANDPRQVQRLEEEKANLARRIAETQDIKPLTELIRVYDRNRLLPSVSLLQTRCESAYDDLQAIEADAKELQTNLLVANAGNDAAATTHIAAIRKRLLP